MGCCEQQCYNVTLSHIGLPSDRLYVKVKPKDPDSPSRTLGMNVAFIVTDTPSWVVLFIISSSGRAGDLSGQQICKVSIQIWNKQRKDKNLNMTFVLLFSQYPHLEQ